MSTRKNYQLVPGEAWNVPLYYAQEIGTTGATGPINLSGYTASAIFTSTSGDVLLELGEINSPGVGVYKNGPTGYIRLGLSEDQVSSLQPKAYYKIFIENNTDATDRIALLHGAVTFVV